MSISFNFSSSRLRALPSRAIELFAAAIAAFCLAICISDCNFLMSHLFFFKSITAFESANLAATAALAASEFALDISDPAVSSATRALVFC